MFSLGIRIMGYVLLGASTAISIFTVWASGGGGKNILGYFFALFLVVPLVIGSVAICLGSGVPKYIYLIYIPSIFVIIRGIMLVSRN